MGEWSRPDPPQGVKAVSHYTICGVELLIFYVVYSEILQKSYAIVHDFYEIHPQICGFSRQFHLCLTDFS